MGTVYFISGPLNLSQDEFEVHYKDRIDRAAKCERASFVVGDARGCDLAAQQYLFEIGVTNVTVFHMWNAPRNNPHGYPTVGGFETDEARDAVMTSRSTDDILYIRSAEAQRALLGKKYKGGHVTGTEKNRTRRLQQAQK